MQSKYKYFVKRNLFEENFLGKIWIGFSKHSAMFLFGDDLYQALAQVCVHQNGLNVMANL